MGKSFRISASEKDTVDMDLYKTHIHTHNNASSDIPTIIIKSSRFHASKDIQYVIPAYSTSLTLILLTWKIW
jgi:hypothetical protein